MYKTIRTSKKNTTERKTIENNMENTCIFIIGTNCSGKTTVVREIIDKQGGIKYVEPDMTVIDGLCLAGRYNVKYGGVDNLNGTAGLYKVVSKGIREHGTIICEGSYMATFGDNLKKALFCAERRLVVLLYASLKEINRRLLERTGKGITIYIKQKQRSAILTAIKWRGIGVNVVSFNTEEKSAEEIADYLINYIKG